jgi:futalosine hydrolase
MHTKPLVVAATYAEIEAIAPMLNREHIPYLITGVGMVATTYNLTKVLRTASFPYIINVGIAGSLDKNLALGALVEVTKDHFSELGAEDKDQFLAIEDLGFGQSVWHGRALAGLETGLPQVEGITVNTVHGHEPSIARVLARYPQVQVESMEGAAIFYVCAAEEVPCFQVRAISNYVEERDRNRWNIPVAVQNLNNWLMKFLTS